MTQMHLRFDVETLGGVEMLGGAKTFGPTTDSTFQSRRRLGRPAGTDVISGGSTP
jgi:hypothetical protein